MPLNKIFQHSDKDIQVLLASMLEFNPFFRSSAAECLKNPIFDSIRVPALELPAKVQVQLDIDAIDAYDYDNRIDLKCPTMSYYKRKIIEEISLLRNDQCTK